MGPQQIKANAQVVAASVIYGFAGIFYLYIKNMVPGAVVFYQLLFGFLTLAGYLAVTGKFSEIRLKGKRKGLILLGVWHTGVMLSYYTAVSFTSISMSVLLLYTAPFYILLFAPFLLKEKLNYKSFAALAISLTGILIVVGPENIGSGQTGIESGYLFGVIMGLFSGFFYACIIMTSRYLKEEYSGFEQLFLSTGVTLVLLLPFITQAPSVSVIENLPLLLFLGISVTSIGSILYFTGLIHVKAQNASIISLLEPVSAIFFAYLFFEDTVSSRTLVGCVLILSSSLFVSLQEGKETIDEDTYPFKKEN